MSSFGDLPSGASLKPKPFKAHASDQELADFKQLLKLSKIGPRTYENTIADTKDFTSFGITRDWLAETKQYWETKYDWRKTEDKINGYPNFTVPIKDDSTGFTFDIHFIALFSKKADAVPLLLLHGWPGSPLEFLGALSVLMEKYTPDTLPYHVIVPSLPGYAYSSGPPLDQNFDTEGIARVVDKLMIGLGFEKGYITQGGDIGSFVSRVLAVTAKSCLAAHINLFIGIQGEPEGLSEAELAGVERYSNFGNVGNAYARMHGTRPGTIGLVLSSSPVALLAWVGEKLQAWTAETPSVEELLDSVTLYWLTESFPRAIFPYRQFFGAKPTFFHNEPSLYINKPMGYSWHPKELAPVPKAWVATSGNLVWYKEHSQGGHFAAWEVPKVFVEDIESFVKEVWPTVSPKLSSFV